MNTSALPHGRGSGILFSDRLATEIELVTTALANLAVECRDLAKDFGSEDTRVRALRGITLEVAWGELTLLVGPSGCGKTTLVSIIAGLLDPTCGRVCVLGKELSQLSQEAKARFRMSQVGFVFQQYYLLPALTAAENVAVPLLMAGIKRQEALARARSLLELFLIGHRADALPRQLSGGQQQRVAIARALIHEPRLLICDEPTAALDAQAGHNVMKLLRRATLAPHRAVIVVTHDSRVLRFGDRIVRMDDGHVVEVEINRNVSCDSQPEI